MKSNAVEKMTERSKGGGALSVGVDIGTTTISAVVYDLDAKEQLEAYTLTHDAHVSSDIRSEQNVFVILDKAEKLLAHILRCYTNVIGIGLTGQMHGIVYIDGEGNPLSHLINWQDKRADLPLDDGKTTCERIWDTVGESVATGYGIATHYYHLLCGKVPDRAVGFCSIMDLFGMKLCGLKKAIVHTSVAASFGLFDIKRGAFLEDAARRLGISEAFLPDVTGESRVIGEYKGIPVSVAIGDNQASFLGSAGANADVLLVNIGTGSQISAVSDYREAGGDVELRPFIEGRYLLCGSALCGGSAYSMLEKFFRSYAVFAGMQDVSQYPILNRLAEEAYESGKCGLDVDVSFFGKRSDPTRRGTVHGIGIQNFTPEDLVLGVLKGMCEELHTLYECFAEKKTKIVASGGAVKKNTILKRLIGDRFGMTVSVNAADEEAALGAALFSALAVGKIENVEKFSEYVK